MHRKRGSVALAGAISALLLLPNLALAGGPPGGLEPLPGTDTASDAVQPVAVPGVATPGLAAASQEASRIEMTGDAMAQTQATSGATYWFTGSWSSGDSRLSDYSTWTWYKINGRSDLFFVVVQGSAYTYSGYNLTRFEPYIRSNTSPARLGNWNPGNQLVVNDGQQITLSLSYSGASVSTVLYTSSQTYNPYAWSTMYSVEWRGSKGPNNTVGNRHVSRWFGGQPWGMAYANCGRGTIVWGNCSNR